MLKTFLAILLGVLLWGGLWAFAGSTLPSLLSDHFDEEGFARTTVGLGALVGVSALLSVLAGLLCARITGSMKSVWILALVQLAIGIFFQSRYWDEFPLGYHVVFLALVIPFHLLGGKLGTKASD